MPYPNAGGGGSSSVTGTMGGGGSGGGGCVAGATLPCDTGMQGTCATGAKKCRADGTGYGACQQTVQPTTHDDCVNMVDTSCDGKVSCACKAGDSMSCTTTLHGPCKPGTATCLADQSGFDTCVPNVMPAAQDDCDNMVDANCDGMLECACTPASTMSCDTGQLGICAAGTETCANDGMSYGACVANASPGIENCASPADENCDGYDCVIAASIYGDSATQGIAHLARDAANNWYAFGDFNGALKFGTTTLIAAGSYDLYLAKFDATGAPLWALQFGGTSAEYGDSIAVDSAGNLIVGGVATAAFTMGTKAVQTGAFVAKLDPTGTPLWVKSLGGSFGCGFVFSTTVSVDVTAQNDIVIGGTACAKVDFGDGLIGGFGGADVFVGKLRGSDGSGKVTDGYWGKVFGDATDQGSAGAVVDATGNIGFAGSFNGTINLGLGAHASAGSTDVFLVKFTPTGTPLWQAFMGDAATQTAGAIAVDSVGSFYVGGSYSGQIAFTGPNAQTITAAGGGDGLLFKFNTAGTYQWSKSFGDATYQAVSGIAIGPADDVLMTGSNNGVADLGAGPMTTAGMTDMVFAKYTSAGALKWAKQFGGAGNDYSGPMIVDATGQAWVSGTTDQSIDFGTGTLTSAGAGDLLLVHLGM